MAKKDKKKGKKQAGDWSDDEPATPAAPVVPNGDEDEDDFEAQKSPSSASRFANFSSFVDDNAGDDDEDDGGGLMATIRSNENKKKAKKDKKKAKKGAIEDEDGEEALEGDAGIEEIKPSQAPVQMTAEELMEEEFGPVKAKGKGKKGKKGKTQYQPGMDDDDDFLDQQIKNLSVKEDQPAPAQDPKEEQESVPAPPPATPSATNDEAVGDGEPTGVLSKKEKERLKKEKEKAKKKAQAAAKKAVAPGGTEATEDKAAPEAAPAAKAEAAEAGEDGEEEEAATSSSKNKKKKKKAGAKAEEPAAAAKPAAGKKVPAHIAALQAAMAKQKAEQEELRRQEEERIRKIEEEEARLAEIERQKEEEKRRKKEKEKAKIDQLKKEGKYMTPKQKAEAAAAKARRDAMIASGQIKVEGLEADQEAVSAPKVKKPTYGKKKPQAKKAGTGGLAAPDIITSGTSTPTAPESPVVEQPTISSDPTRTEEHEPTEAADDWDAPSDTEAKAAEAAPADEAEELDDWDAESVSDREEEVKKSVEKAKPASATAKPVTKPAAKKADEPKKPQTNGTPAKPAEAPAKSKAAPAKAPVKEEEESSEEEEEDDEEDASDSDDDSDSDEDSDDDSGSDSDSDSEEERISAAKRQAAQRKAQAAARRQQKREEAIAAGSKDDLRSPICCILGHVDTGKTKLLDKIRQSNVQEGEAGGITQQIGATYFPREVIQAKTAPLGEANIKEYKLPGLLVIDTPGHESFTNLRTRGSSLCNIAILVVDIMHGLEPQTIESIRLLRTGKTPFIVALNKIDRLYGWQPTPDGGFQDSLAKQSKAVKNEFERRLQEAQVAFAEQGLNAIPYYENNNYAKNVSIVPTSAHTGEGIPDMLMLITKLTQERMSSQLMYITELECTVLEVKVIEGLGTTLDVVLVNGVLHEGDRIVVCGLNGPIVTQIRALLTPQPLKELRVRGQYVHHQTIKAAMGIKIVAPDLEKAIAGSRLLVVGEDDDEEDLKEAVMEDLQSLASSVDKSGKGVYVQASTLGSLEALLEFLKQSKIPVSNINIGPVHKKDVTRCAAMLDKTPELAVILAFDVPVDKDAERLAEENNIKIFKADIIYHLFDDFTKHNAAILEAKRKDAAPTAVWPCRLRILKCFAKRDPIILGCDIIEGSTLRVGTPLAVVKTDPETKKKTIIKLGKVTSLEINHKAMDVVKKSQQGAGVAVKIEHAVYESAKLFGRHFNEHDELVSLISRQSIDTLKEHFKEQVDKDDWVLIAKKLKPLLDIA